MMATSFQELQLWKQSIMEHGGQWENNTLHKSLVLSDGSIDPKETSIDLFPVTPTPPPSSSFREACETGNSEKIKDILLQGADINQRFERGLTPIHVASMFGHREVVARLQQAGADVNTLSDEGVTPLHLACLKGRLNIVVLLLSFGARPNVKDKLGNTSLHLAVSGQNTPKELIESLLDAGADMKTVNSANQTVFDRAEKAKNGPVIALLKNRMQ